MAHFYALLDIPGLAHRRHPATRTFGNTSGRTTLFQFSSHEFQTHPSSSHFAVPLGSMASPNEARSLSRFGAFGKPSRRFCIHSDREHINSRPRWEVDYIRTCVRKYGGKRTYLKMISQPGSVLEYDAVQTIHDEFREAFSLREYEMIVLRPV